MKMAKSLREIRVAGSAIVYNDMQGKDYMEPVIITFGHDASSRTWEVQMVENEATNEILWP